MLSHSLKSNKLDIFILVIITIFVFTAFILNIIHGGKGIYYVIFQYIAYPIFSIGIIYISLHSYVGTMSSERSKKLAYLMFLSYVSIMIIIYAIIIVTITPYILHIPNLLGLSTYLSSSSLLPFVLFALSYAVAFPLIFSISIVAESITYAIIGRINAPFITRDSNYLIVWLFNYPRYGGTAFGGVYKGFIIIRTPSNAVDEVSRGILVHEVQHVRGKHVPLVVSSMFAVVTYIMLTSNVYGKYLFFVLPFMFLAPLVLFRACEVNADRAMFRTYSSKALNYIFAVLKSTYGVSSTDKAPWASKLTHTGRRDLVLTYGDAIAPHAPWEFPLLFSLLTASVITALFVSRADLLVSNARLVTYLALLTYVGSVLGSIILSVLLGLVLKPIARLFLGRTLTERGLLNISTFTAGLYLAVMSFAFYGISQYVLIILFLLVILLIVGYYVGINSRSFSYVALSVVMLLAISFAVQFTLVSIIHFVRILPTTNAYGA